MSSAKERIDEIMSDIKGRFRNPLILSFILVWLYFHWKFVYELITVDKNIAVGIRADYFKKYVSEQGWSGMMGYPLIFAFISLASYYLIGIAAQFIKLMIGKRFEAFIIYKFDKGKYELKETTDKLKKENRELTKQRNTSIDENETNKSKLRIKESELLTAKELHEKALSEKDQEIGELMALNTDIHREKKEEVDKRLLTEAENKKFSDDLDGQDKMFREYEKDLSFKDELISEQQAKIDDYERSQKLYEELQKTKIESPFNLSLDDRAALHEIFGKFNWEAHFGKRSHSAIMVYTDGVFNFSDGTRSFIQNINFKDGIIYLYRTNENKEVANVFTTLRFKGKKELIGSDVTFSPTSFGIESSFDISFTRLD